MHLQQWPHLKTLLQKEREINTLHTQNSVDEVCEPSEFNLEMFLLLNVRTLTLMHYL